VAKERVRAAQGVAPVLRVSFVKVLELLRPLWLFLAIGRGILSEPQQRQLIQRFYDYMLLKLVQERQSRSCPRKVRQPVGKWPRLLKIESWEGPLTFSILRSLS